MGSRRLSGLPEACLWPKQNLFLRFIRTVAEKAKFGFRTQCLENKTFEKSCTKFCMKAQLKLSQLGFRLRVSIVHGEWNHILLSIWLE